MAVLPYGKQVNIINWRGDDAPWNMNHGLRNVIEALYLGGWTTFRHSRAVISLCAPGRMAGFTGLVPQRHLMWDNASGDDVDWQQTYFVDLAKRGYRNGVFGKLLNGAWESGHGGFTPPNPLPGVHYMRAIHGAPNYFENTFIRQDGVLVGGLEEADSGNHTPGDGQVGDTYYYPKLWRTHVTNFLATVPIGQPWSIYIGDKASHIDTVGGEQVVSTETQYAATSITWTDDPSFGVSPTGGNSRQPQHIIDNAETNWSNSDAVAARALHLDRLRSLYTSDDSLKVLIDLVVTRGELANTLIIISCDQTDFSGQLQSAGGKGTNNWASNMLSMSIRSPVAAASPNNTCDAVVNDMDIAETIRHACGAGHSYQTPDGMSMIPLLATPELAFRYATPYFNLYKNPEIAGLTTADGRTYGKGTPEGGYPHDEFCWDDPYNIHNIGKVPELSTMVDVLLDIHGRAQG